MKSLKQKLLFNFESAEKRISKNFADGLKEYTKAGHELLAVKEALGHGHFTKWLEPRLVDWKVSGQTIRNYMNLAKREAKLGPVAVANMSFKEAAKSTKPHKPKKLPPNGNTPGKIQTVVNLTVAADAMSWPVSESAEQAVAALVQALEAAGDLARFDREYCLAGKDAFEHAYLSYMNKHYPMSEAA